MKRFLLLALVAIACFAASEAQAQTISIGASGIKFNDSDPSQQKVEPVGASPIIHIDKTKKDALTIKVGRDTRTTIPMFELGWNVPTNVWYTNYIGMDVGEFFELRNIKSVQTTLNIVGGAAYSRRCRMGIAASLGFRWNNYRFDNPAMTLSKGNGLIMPSPIVDYNGKSSKKSKFTTAAFHIPAELIFGNPSRFAFSMGGYVDININNHTKIKYNGGHKEKEWNFPVEPIQMGAVARLRFKAFSVYGAYQPTQLFKTGRGPEMSQWTIGIGFY